MNAVPATHAIAAQPALSAAVSELLKRKPRLLVSGGWVETHGKGGIPVMDPATGRQIAEVADADAEDVDSQASAATFRPGR